MSGQAFDRFLSKCNIEKRWSKWKSTMSQWQRHQAPEAEGWAVVALNSIQPRRTKHSQWTIMHYWDILGFKNPIVSPSYKELFTTPRRGSTPVWGIIFSFTLIRLQSNAKLLKKDLMPLYLKSLCTCIKAFMKVFHYPSTAFFVTAYMRGLFESKMNVYILRDDEFTVLSCFSVSVKPARPPKNVQEQKE